jgi:glycosyltransferase involved in cell wall biosynthesis
METIISFIIPSYNVETYLKTCLDSFLAPDMTDEFEVIVIDDGSSDNTYAIADYYVKLHPKVYRLIKKENGGHGSAINVGSRIAQGKYIKVIDADDWIVTENLKELLAFLRTCDSDVVLNPFHMVDMSTNKRVIRCMFINDYRKDYTLNDIMCDWKSFDRCLTFHGIIYNTTFYNKYRHDLPEKIFYEDQEYASIPCCHAEKIRAMNLYLYEYLVGNSNQSVASENQLKRIAHIEQVAVDMTQYYSSHLELTKSGKEYLAQKIEGVILSYYTIACIVNPNKADGRKKCRKLNGTIHCLSRDIFVKIRKKYRIYLLLNLLNISENQYQFLLQSRIYNWIKKNHICENR